MYATPEELFYKLSGRAKSHGYLRGPQQDVLREYADKHQKTADLAFELPTGTGKTTVGLLVAEWWRTQSRKVAYLSLTNQLAGQVLEEAKRLKIAFADVRGTKETRNAAEEGRYRTGAAVAITTYSNLFNINPVIHEADVIVFDDAHGAEQYVADTWAVNASASKFPELYNSLLAALRPGLTESQVRSVLEKSPMSSVEMPDVHGHPECIANVISVLDTATAETAKFAWRLIRHRVQSCLFLVSAHAVTIRPLVPPTHTHEPFARAKQRIYMSATLGGESDLQRTYGIEKLSIVRAKSPQWGRRYIFVPGVYASPADADKIVAEVWDGLKARRAVLLAPSDRVLEETVERLASAMQKKPKRMGAADIAETIDGFVGKTEVLLALAGRYDGLDLPDEQCRLLILSESPAAINAFEKHLSERWKMGPVLRKRERTRLIQGMGRCTRNATDFAVIIWLGQSLVNAATSPSLLGGFPPELSAEVNWGVRQSETAAKKPGSLVQMILGLILDSEYRKGADEALEEVPASPAETSPKDFEAAGREEVRFAKAMWDENYEQAHEAGHRIADELVSAELSGYRAWWWYLSSVAASLAGNVKAEADCLQRGAKCGINSGWLNQLLHRRIKGTGYQKDAGIEVNAEGVWDQITKWGWAGPTFEDRLQQMVKLLKITDHAGYHEGLDLLGQCFGAATTRKSEQGAPDVVWSFANDLHVAFEAKTEKKASGELAKKDVTEAKGHVDWVHDRLCQDPEKADIHVVVVAPTPALHQVALPFAGGLFYLAPDSILKLAERIVESIRKLRVKFSGREFAEAAVEFSAALRNMGLDLESAKKALLTERLKK
jgi:hypothetical protein